MLPNLSLVLAISLAPLVLNQSHAQNISTSEVLESSQLLLQR